MSTQKKAYVLKNKFYLDLQTGFIKGATEVIETDERYKNRFIPWLAPIPKGGRVNLADWQKQTAVSAEKSAEEIAEWNKYQEWKKAHEAAQGAAGTTETVGAPAAVTVSSNTGAENPIPATGIQDSVPLSIGQRYDKIMSVMNDLTVEDMTKSPINQMPTVAALARLTGLNDIQGPERESIFKAFKDANPDWKPKAA